MPLEPIARASGHLPPLVKPDYSPFFGLRLG
jgi:hypothetical protein